MTADPRLRKKQRTSSPSPAGSSSPSISHLVAPSSSALAPTSSITALGNRFAGALAAASVAQSSSPAQQATITSSRTEKGRAQATQFFDGTPGPEEQDEDEEEQDDIDEYDTQSPRKPAQAASSSQMNEQQTLDSLRGSQAGGGPILREEGSLESVVSAGSPTKSRVSALVDRVESAPPSQQGVPMEVDQVNEDDNVSPSPTLRATSEDDIATPPTPSLTSAAKPESTPIKKPTSSQAVAGPSGSPARRTKEEIAELRRAAQAKLLAKQEAPLSQALRSNNHQVQAQHRSFAETHLKAYGFKVGAPRSGMSRYGSGKGGFGEPVIEQTTGAPQIGIVDGGAGAAEARAVWEDNPLCSEEQLQVLQQCRERKNIFFTGSAGVGKSFLLHEITRLLEFERRPYQVTATTGIAALQINGSTLHSWAGVGLGKDPVLTLSERILGSKEKRTNWVQTEVLIIDEVSMIDPILFTKLNLLGKLLRKNNRPFGGLQLIVSGDYFQLPPVPEKHLTCMRCGEGPLETIPLADSRLPYQEIPRGLPQPEVLRCTDRYVDRKLIPGCGLEWRAVTFAFETETWAECSFKVMELTQVFRQTDPDFIVMLEKFRRGQCDEESVKLLQGCGTALQVAGAIKPTNLYPLRDAVARENAQEYKKLRDKAYTFEADDAYRGVRGKDAMKTRLKDCPPDEKLNLKKGAQVLLLANLDVKSGLVNGSRGVIVDWIKQGEEPVEHESLAGVRTAAEPSRNRGRGGFGSEEWRETAANDFIEKQLEAYLPVVFFACGTTRVVSPHTWCIDIDRENSVARTQIPLALAWALTIHKSQGQSLDAVGVRLTSTFEKGQAYVALSRCRTPAGMKVEGFKPGHVMAHPTVIAYYTNIAKGLPFITSSVSPVNPLVYIPDHDPRLLKDRQIYGPRPKPLPIGSAILAPGQAPPRRFSPEPSPELEIMQVAPVVYTTWQDLLAQASQAYANSNLGSSDAFVDQAKLLVDSAMAQASDSGSSASRNVSPEDTRDARPTLSGHQWKVYWQEQARLRREQDESQGSASGSSSGRRGRKRGKRVGG